MRLALTSRAKPSGTDTPCFLACKSESKNGALPAYRVTAVFARLTPESSY